MNDVLRTRATAQGGVISTTEAQICGYDRQDLHRLTRRGELLRIGIGTFAEPETYLGASPEQRHRLLTRSMVARSGGRLAASHGSALCLLALPTWRVDLDRAHLTRTSPGPGRRSKDVVVHRGYGFDAWVGVDGVRCVDPALAVLGTAMVAGVESGVVAADAALARGLTTAQRLGHWLNRLTRHPGVGDARLAVELADPRAESPGESRSRLILTALDLGELIPQVVIRDDDGAFVGRVDLLYAARRTIVEFDGQVKYGGADGRQALIAEKRREDRLRALGYAVVRITWADLDCPAQLRRRLLAAFASTAAYTR